jgi:hypothetical protein
MIRAMKRAALALVLAACSSSANDFPPLPEGAPPVGPSSGGGTSGDAGIADGGSDGDAGVPITGQVCLVQDLRTPTSKCEPMKAGGLKVTLSTPGASDAGTVVGTTTTGPDGRFTIIAPRGPGTWRVTGVAIATSVMLYGTENTIPAILAEQYILLRNSNSIMLGDGEQGDAVVQVVRGASPVTGISATVSPLAASLTQYDSNNSLTDWNTNATQAGGIVWIPNAQPGTAHITLSATEGTINTLDTTIESQAITFVTRPLP